MSAAFTKMSDCVRILIDSYRQHILQCCFFSKCLRPYVSAEYVYAHFAVAVIYS